MPLLASSYTPAWGDVSPTQGYLLLSRHSRILWDERGLIPAEVITKLTLTMGFLSRHVPFWTPVPACTAAQILPWCVPVAQHVLSCLQPKHLGIFLVSLTSWLRLHVVRHHQMTTGGTPQPLEGCRARRDEVVVPLLMGEELEVTHVCASVSVATEMSIPPRALIFFILELNPGAKPKHAQSGDFLLSLFTRSLVISVSQWSNTSAFC